jgi:hypothetical protein
MSKTKLHATILVGLAILFAGCAVLTVDVDVYKGPLANHQDIQMEQMAAMAIGAKPLLVELRDILEANYMNRLELYELHTERDPNSPKHNPQLESQIELYWDYGGTSIETRLRILRDQPWYKTNFVEPYGIEGNITKSYFLDSNADHVNNILSLYEDQKDKQYSLLMSRVRQALNDYITAYDILRPDSNEADIQHWEKLELRPDSFKDKAKILLPGKPSGEDIKNLSGRIEELRSKYEQYCTDPERDAKDLFKSWFPIRDKLGEKVPDALRDNKLLKGKDEELKKSPNAQAYAFAETELVDFHAEHLFGLKDKKKDEFVNYVKEISQAFLDSRDALERHWRAEMEAIICLSDKQGEASSDWEWDVFKRAKASLEVIQPRYVAVFLDLNVLTKDREEDTPKEVGYLNGLLSKLTRSKLAGDRRSQYWQNSSDYEEAKAIFLAEFIRRPAEMAKGLLACHEYCKWELDPNVLNTSESTKTTSLQYKSGWKFGLVRAPFDPNVPKEVFVQGNLTQYTEGLGGGAFAKGRLIDGLETLIEKYLKQAEVCNPNNDELHITRQQLSDALVRFAEKLLFVANNRSLMSPPKSDPGLLLGTSLGLYRLLFGETFVKWAAERGFLGSLFEDTEQYTRILQAVGNSIIVQADALHQERKHRERLKNHYDKEITILADTVSRMSPIHRNTIGIKPVDELLPENATGKDVRDVWIELLEYEHDLALYYGETQRAKEIDEALKSARTKRENMIFIRPAMAYLRTSFPATSLQSNPNLTWDNMLGGHMMRSIPFAPQIGEFLNPDAKRDARITAEIDKQFWQNINRVRVAGGGDTNYAVVKDDIGNWYVKGYSADPCDVITSAKNLALFAAGARTGAGMLPRRESDKSKRTDEGNAKRTGIENVFARYHGDYTRQTLDDYTRLESMLKSSKLEDQIREVWEQNEDISPERSHKGVKILKQLNEQMSSATQFHLKEVRKRLSRKPKDTPEQVARIFEGLGSLRRFHGDLVARIKRLDLPGQAEEKFPDESDADEAQQERERAERAERTAVNAVTSAVRARIGDMLDRRRDAVDDYQTALLVIGQAGGQ